MFTPVIPKSIAPRLLHRTGGRFLTCWQVSGPPRVHPRLPLPHYRERRPDRRSGGKALRNDDCKGRVSKKDGAGDRESRHTTDLADTGRFKLRGVFTEGRMLHSLA